MLFFGSFFYSQSSRLAHKPAGQLLAVAVLLTNAVAILSEDRFLARNVPLQQCTSALTYLSNLAVNLSPASYDPAFGANSDTSVTVKVINLIASVRTLMRVPLIVCNTLIILYELVLG
ncbi:Protein transport protein YOS1 [Ceratocystis lukuohia]|uniref:Protein transport protein YOS1 n=1 Tax=Ceratocystis lukuohia TaxID=2019550 RepID=A0ABR4MNF0_9PEZI